MYHNVLRQVFLVRADLVFVGIRYEHLGYMTSEQSLFYTTLVLTDSGLCIPQRGLNARARFLFLTKRPRARKRFVPRIR